MSSVPSFSAATLVGLPYEMVEAVVVLTAPPAAVLRHAAGGNVGAADAEGGRDADADRERVAADVRVAFGVPVTGDGVATGLREGVVPGGSVAVGDVVAGATQAVITTRPAPAATPGLAPPTKRTGPTAVTPRDAFT